MIAICIVPAAAQVTIPVGDYVLSRDVCVERKAIIDLVQSLGSGRLYQQAQNMCLHYSNPLLLIEFDPAKGFVLQSSYAIARREIEVGTKDLLGKLSLLVLHFPKLRLMWSPSPRFTADIFMKLKDRVSGSLHLVTSNCVAPFNHAHVYVYVYDYICNVCMYVCMYGNVMYGNVM